MDSEVAEAATQWRAMWLDAVHEAIEDQDVTVSAVADAAGVSKSTLTRALKGETWPRADTIVAVSALLHVTLPDVPPVEPELGRRRATGRPVAPSGQPTPPGVASPRQEQVPAQLLTTLDEVLEATLHLRQLAGAALEGSPDVADPDKVEEFLDEHDVDLKQLTEHVNTAQKGLRRLADTDSS